MASTGRIGVLRFVRDPIAGESDADLLQRYTAGDDERAFGAILARYGPVVWSVCRRMLRNHHDAEDAFQATFLVLARGARGIRSGAAVSGWLCGVATHVASRMRSTRRPEQTEVEPADGHSNGPLGELTVREAEVALYEELAQLPEKYRAPLVLCCLEGLSRDEAASRLGWFENQVKHGLERGRERLRARLQRRGIVLGLTLLTSLLAAPAGAVPPPMMDTAVRFATGAAPPAAISSLAHGVHRAMWISKWKWAAALSAVLVLTAGGMLTAALLEAPQPRPAPTKAAPNLVLVEADSQQPPTPKITVIKLKVQPKEPWELAADYLQAIVDGKPDQALKLADPKKIGERRIKEIQTAGLKRVRPVMILLNDYQALVVFERAKLKRAPNAQPDDLHAVVQLQRKDGPEPWLVTEHDVTGESSVWRETDDYLMGKFNFNRVPNKIQPEPLKDTKKPTWTVAEEFLKLALLGKTADALKLTVPGTISETKVGDVKNIGIFTSSAPILVLMNDNRIEVAFQWMTTDKMAVGHVVLMLTRSKDGKWQVKDIDFRDQERLEPRVKLYLAGEYDQKPAK